MKQHVLKKSKIHFFFLNIPENIPRSEGLDVWIFFPNQSLNFVCEASRKVQSEVCYELYIFFKLKTF